MFPSDVPLLARRAFPAGAFYSPGAASDQGEQEPESAHFLRCFL